MKTKAKVHIVRTEQWEHTASITINKKHYSAVGSSETSAERNLLRKIVFGNEKHLAINEFGKEIR